jgi:nucleoside-diphosphate kinase
MKHHKEERTLVVIKPDGIQRSLMGEIIGRFERIGLKVVAMKMFEVSPELVEKHYTLDPEWRKKTGEKTIKGYLDKGLTPPYTDPLKITEILLGRLKKYLTAGPVVAMVIEGAHSAAIVRKLIGSTEPLTSDVGTIRGDYMLDSYEMSDIDNRSLRNLVHASGDAREAKAEIDLWFKPEEILDYNHVQGRILYDPSLEGLFE